MQKVKLVTKTLDLAATLNAKKEVYTSTESRHLVASTKSYNNLMEDRKREGKVATESVVTDFFLDKDKVKDVLGQYVIQDGKAGNYADMVVDHMIKALDGACVFVKPPIVRKK